jgi:hypothetical protein
MTAYIIRGGLYCINLSLGFILEVFEACRGYSSTTLI